MKSRQKTMKIGTRGSKLALWQAHHVQKTLNSLFPELRYEICKIKTTGDKILETPLTEIGGKALFLKEIEEALLKGEIDFAVHSMKDVPAELPKGLTIAAILKREDPRDVFISKKYPSLLGLPKRAKIGTSSLRRKAQLKNFRPDFEVVSLRGNIDTRLKKLATGSVDGIILAAAGVIRLGQLPQDAEFLDPSLMLPAVGQGSLAIEIREGDERVRERVTPLEDRTSAVCIRAERSLMRELEGGCYLPLAALGELKGEQLTLTGMLADAEGRELVRDRVEGGASQAEDLGRTLAQTLLSRGGREILRVLRGET